MSKQRNLRPDEMRAAAEDAAIEYLAKDFTPEVAAAIATTVEMLLAIRWEEEFLSWDENDTRQVFVITADRMRDIRKAFTEIPRGMSNPRGEQHVFDLLRDLDLDWAWNVARLVRTYLVYKWKARERQLGAAKAAVGVAQL